ncbi:MAG: ABC-F family ATP-binding cassette domain-containing protein [Halocynthiibacter sp.]
MLKIKDIRFSIDGRPLFEGASATIPTGHKVGIVGANGAGKTTLFKLIREELSLDDGAIEIPTKARVGGVAQEVPSSATSLIDTVLAADTERMELLIESETATDPGRIADIQTRLTDIDAWSAESRAASILHGLGFDAVDQKRPCSDFSGGWRMRVALAAVLFSAPDLLLLDEPTNYLDLEGALWLENYLTRYPHTVLIISHDRELLNRSVGGILHLESRKLTLYNVPYDGFAKQRAEARMLQAASAKKQDARRAHLQSFVDRFKAKASKAKQAQSRVKMLEKMTPITAPEDAAKQVFSFPAPETLSPPIIRIEDGSVGYDGTAILRNLNLRIDHDDRIALLGKNGEGKSTLSKLLAERLPLMTGDTTRARKLQVGFFAQHQVEDLIVNETPVQHLQAVRPDETPPKLRARLASFGLMAAQAETEVGKLSGGQKARLSLLLATIDAPHLLILDEPTNHLDIESREGLMEALTAYNGAVILVSHDMHLLSMVADRLWLVQDGRVKIWEDDLAAYRRMLLTGDEKPRTPKHGAKKDKPKVKAAPAQQKIAKPTVLPSVSTAKINLKKAEERLEKLQKMRDRMDELLADPELYAPVNRSKAQDLSKKNKELTTALEKAESLWMNAMEILEKAEKA